MVSFPATVSYMYTREDSDVERYATEYEYASDRVHKQSVP